jgi:hypothetical protein
MNYHRNQKALALIEPPTLLMAKLYSFLTFPWLVKISTVMTTTWHRQLLLLLQKIVPAKNHQQEIS